eukprot:4235381-Amphidinium_carterae.1
MTRWRHSSSAQARRLYGKLAFFRGGRHVAVCTPMKQLLCKAVLIRYSFRSCRDSARGPRRSSQLLLHTYQVNGTLERSLGDTLAPAAVGLQVGQLLPFQCDADAHEAALTSKSRFILGPSSLTTSSQAIIVAFDVTSCGAQQQPTRTRTTATRTRTRTTRSNGAQV